MFRPRVLAAFLILAFVPTIAGQRSTPAETVSTDRLARIDKVMQQAVDENRVPGVVALALRDGRPIYEKAFGWSDKESGRRMATDSIFRIASQSKALTSVAILILMEEGALTLATPVSQFIPSFAKTTVAVKIGE